MAGKPRAARAVGNIMRDCRGADVPAYRVIAAGGRLGGYGGNEALKRALLAAEGVPLRGSRVVWKSIRLTSLPKQTSAKVRGTDVKRTRR